MTQEQFNLFLKLQNEKFEKSIREKYSEQDATQICFILVSCQMSVAFSHDFTK